jgi:hypothetical protein
MRCSSCGHENPPSNAFCERCGADLRFTDVETSGVAYPAVPEERLVGPTSIPGTSIALGDGETVWRTYPVTQLRTREQGQGTLFVTDSRVIFLARARGGGTRRGSALVQETKLEHITGLSAYVSRSASMFWIVLATAFALFTIVGLLFDRWGAAIFYGILTAGAIALLVRSAAKRGTVGVRIQSGSTQASPIGFGAFGEEVRGGFLRSMFRAISARLLSLFGIYTAFDVLMGFPTPDAERVISELGALIIDLQSKGSLAGTHWGVETTI